MLKKSSWENRHQSRHFKQVMKNRHWSQDSNGGTERLQQGTKPPPPLGPEEGGGFPSSGVPWPELGEIWGSLSLPPLSRELSPAGSRLAALKGFLPQT